MGTEEILDKAKELLLPKDSSIDGVLLLNGKEYEIDHFEIQFQQAFDFKGEPQREVKGGLLSLTLNRVTDEQLNYWMFHNKISYSGAIVFRPSSGISNPVLTIQFTNGRLVRYSTFVECPNGINLNIMISAESITVNGIEHTNRS
ncbi:MAG: hypothetical protein CSA05_03665 [Bacteroidia bacterium]|nr:MAG: hypothetical protein CSA05_03665 [Bacteroidia bacterium]